MANKLKNFRAMLSNSRTRTVLIFTVVLLAVGIVFGFLRLHGAREAAGGSSKVANAPRNIQSIPGGFGGSKESAEYAKLQEQQNTEQAKRASHTGKSAIPTLIGSSSLNNQGFGDKGADTRGCVAPGTDVYSANCQVAGRLGPDGVVRSAADAGKDYKQEGNLVYGSDGKVIGHVGPSGEVIGPNGKVIGRVGPNGEVIGPDGKVIGKVSAAAQQGGLVYGPDGKLLGHIGPNGEVIGSSGKVIGHVLPNGDVVGPNGKIIGKAVSSTPGQLVYGSDGKVIGRVGPDGEVIGPNGKVIGRVGPNGEVLGLNGKVIGTTKTDRLHPGTTVYDRYGNPVGTIGPDGKLIPISQHAAASARAAQDAAADTRAGVPGATPGTGNAALQAILERQAKQLNAAEAQQAKQQMQAGMSSQVGQLISAWAPPQQQFVAGTPAKSDEKTEGQSADGQFGVGKGPIIKAGSIMFAILDTSINSDEPGPILATITSGSLKGGKLIGTLTKQKERVLVTFHTLSYKEFPASIGLQAVAIDPTTARTGLSDYTNNHYLLRYGTMFAATFLQGYAQAISQSGSSIVSNGFNTQKNMPSLSPQGELVVALGNVGAKYASILEGFQNTPPTVYVYSGAGMGVLVLSDLRLPSAPVA